MQAGAVERTVIKHFKEGVILVEWRLINGFLKGFSVLCL